MSLDIKESKHKKTAPLNYQDAVFSEYYFERCLSFAANTYSNYDFLPKLLLYDERLGLWR